MEKATKPCSSLVSVSASAEPLPGRPTMRDWDPEVSEDTNPPLPHCFSSEYSPAAAEGKLEHTLGIAENATPKPVSNGKNQNFENGKSTGMQKVSFLNNSIYKNSVSYLIFLSSFFFGLSFRVSSKCFIRNILLLMTVIVSFLSPMSNSVFYL